MWDEYRKEYKVRGGVEMTGKGEPWHTKEEEEDDYSSVKQMLSSYLCYNSNSPLSVYIPLSTLPGSFHLSTLQTLHWPLQVCQPVLSMTLNCMFAHGNSMMVS